MTPIEEFAGLLYETYCQAVGGKAFNGDTLPRWEEFRADPTKQKQSDAWVEVAIGNMRLPPLFFPQAIAAIAALFKAPAFST